MQKFSVDYDAIDTNDILDIHRMFIGLLSACTIGSSGESLTSDSKGSIKCAS